MNKALSLLAVLMTGLCVYLLSQAFAPLSSDSGLGGLPSAGEQMASPSKTNEPRLAQSELTPAAELHTDNTRQPDTHTTMQVKTRPSWRLDAALAEHLDRLLTQAQAGDAEAAYVLGMNLRRCYGVPVDEETYAQRLQQAYDNKADNSSVVNLQLNYQFCLGVSEQQRKEFYVLLAKAAAKGMVPAQEFIAAMVPERYMELIEAAELPREDYIRQRDTFVLQQKSWLEDAAAHGSLQAMVRLAQQNYYQQDGPDGRLKAYAFNQLILNFTDDNELYSRYDRYQQNLQQQLTAEQIAKALEMTEHWTQSVNQNGSLYPF
ncbi:hypothetical protein ACFO3I_07795 [Rheinheimera marina]|uniref:Sel1 repeat family protein n=1 Tax=Rheinheimera marina TaxID=1774958 RepID=A0ABV9JKY3_9GAMM